MAEPQRLVEPAPVRLVMISTTSPPIMEIGPEGHAVDLRPSFKGMDINVSPTGECTAGLYLNVDPQHVDWPVDRIAAKGGAHPADTMSPEDWDAVILSGGNEMPGKKIVAHLRMLSGYT